MKKMKNGIWQGIAALLVAATVISLIACSGGKESSDGPAAGMQRMGNDQVGYVDVPENWSPFAGAEEGDVQYADPSGKAILTLSLFNGDGLSEEEKQKLDPETAAKMVYVNIQQAGGAVEASTVDFREYQAYQLSALYGDGIYLLVWLTDPGDGKIHYIAAEGPENAIQTVIGYVGDSFRMRV